MKQEGNVDGGHKFMAGMVLSVLFHAGLFGGAKAYFYWRAAGLDQAMDIDLRGSSLLLKPHGAVAQAAPVAPPRPWELAAGSPARPLARPLSVTVEAEPEEPRAPPCPPPCPQNPSDWLAAGSVSRRPEWQGEISEDEYPEDARHGGKEGRVVAQVLIDDGGEVRGLTILQSSGPAFADLVRRKLLHSRFTPALDAAGTPVACRLVLPFLFRLE